MTVKGKSVDAIFFGDTVINDVHAVATFNYALSNPPFGAGWKDQQKAQRGHGIIPRSAAEERPRPPALDHTRATAHRDGDLGRTDLPPSAALGWPGPFGAHRFRDHYEHYRRAGGVTTTCHLSVQQCLLKHRRDVCLCS